MALLLLLVCFSILQIMVYSCNPLFSVTYYTFFFLLICSCELLPWSNFRIFVLFNPIYTLWCYLSQTPIHYWSKQSIIVVSIHNSYGQSFNILSFFIEFFHLIFSQLLLNEVTIYLSDLSWTLFCRYHQARIRRPDEGPIFISKIIFLMRSIQFSRKIKLF